MKRIPLLPLSVVLLSTLVCFLPALRFGFLYWDDVKNIVTNPYLRQLNFSSLHWMWTTHFQGPYQPLSWLSLAWDFKCWGLQPWGYHLTNVTFHLTNVALVYYLLRRLFDQESSGWIAGLGALFFAIHPLRVESVVWVTERRDVLSGFFFFLSLIAYLRRQLSWSIPLFIAALLSKATAVGLVWILIALDMTVLHRLPLDPRQWFVKEYRPVWREKLIYGAMAFVVGACNLWMFHVQGILQSRYSMGGRVALFLHNATFYVQKMVCPYPLLPYYELPVHLSEMSPSLVLHGTVTVFLTVACWLWRQRFPGLIVAWLTYLGMLFPISGVAQNGQQSAADRYTYLTLLPWTALGVVILQRYRKTRGAALIVLGTLAIRTWFQTQVWRNDETLWAYTLRFAPDTYLAHSNLGTLYFRQRRDNEAYQELALANRLRPTEVGDALNLGSLEVQHAHWDRAESIYRRVLVAEPGNKQIQNNLALVKAHQGHFTEAITLLRHILASDPNFAEAQLNLGALLLQQGEKAEGKAHIERAWQLKPELKRHLPRSLS